MEETGVPGENHRITLSHWRLSHMPRTLNPRRLLSQTFSPHKIRTRTKREIHSGTAPNKFPAKFSIEWSVVEIFRLVLYRNYGATSCNSLASLAAEFFPSELLSLPEIPFCHVKIVWCCIGTMGQHLGIHLLNWPLNFSLRNYCRCLKYRSAMLKLFGVL